MTGIPSSMAQGHWPWPAWQPTLNLYPAHGCLCRHMVILAHWAAPTWLPPRPSLWVSTHPSAPTHPRLPFSPTCRKSQIQTFLEQNEGPGLQHLALKTDDIVATLREMRARSAGSSSIATVQQQHGQQAQPTQ